LRTFKIEHPAVIAILFRAGHTDINYFTPIYYMSVR